MAQRKYVAKPSGHSEKDYPITMLAPKLQVFPKTFRILYAGQVKNQGEVGSCVAHSASYCREMVEHKQSGVFKQFSVGFVYANRKPTDSQDEGMMPREMLDNLMNCGDVLYEDFPYNEDYPHAKGLLEPKKDILLAKASQYKVSSYARLTSIEEIKSALMQLGPVTIGIPVYDSYENVGPDGIVPIPDTEHEQCLGYHENTLVGWTEINNKPYLIDLNSWGPEWGDKGYCYLPMDFPISEAWSMTDNILPQASMNPDDHKFYRVQTKEFKIKLFAIRDLDKARKAGFKNAVLDKYNNHYIIQLGAFTEADQDKATALMDEVKNKLASSAADFVIRYY